MATITIRATKDPNDYDDTELQISSEYIDGLRTSIVACRNKDTKEWYIEDFTPFDNWLKRAMKRLNEPQLSPDWQKCARTLIAIVQAPLTSFTAEALEAELFSFREGGDDYYLVTAPSLPGLIAEGKSPEEALAIADDLIPVLLDLSRE